MLQNIQLEFSLKPFRKVDDASIDAVCRTIFTHWKPLVKDVPTVSLMLWAADGCEILDYKKNMDEPFEWAKWVGGPNRGGDERRAQMSLDPDAIGLHTRAYLYMQDPPVMTYGILKKIVAALRRVGKEILGEDKHILVGDTFDTGYEFAKSPFRYERHPEILYSDHTWKNTFLCSYAKLHADDVPYAGYPNGIPEGLPFGTFFGRQAQHFLSDLGFDFIWFSNGLGFTREYWTTVGPVFNGERFIPEAMDFVQKSSLEFWDLFTAECSFPIETRGTNMTMGIDMATDAVPLGAIYKKNPTMLPPPNSPWAALNGDYGLEIAGYLSRIAELPAQRYLFRYYLHDPWWANSPWYDRYNGLPHDIYLPLACARIDENGKVQKPTDLSLLTIDNSFGEMPDSCVIEATPHLLKGYKDAPDAPSPFVWVYPFGEYNTANEVSQLNGMFAEDWYIRNAINNGLPLSSVTSVESFLKQDLSIYSGSVLVTPVPQAGSAFEAKILDYAKNGGKAIFYGRAERASEAFLAYMNLVITEDEVDGELPITVNGQAAGILKVNTLTAAGKLNTVLRDANGTAQAFAEAGGKVIAVQNGTAIWLRATVSADYTGDALLSPHDRTKYYISEELMIEAMAKLGWTFRAQRSFDDSNSPVYMLCRSDNAFMLSVFASDTTVGTRMCTPLGAPLFIGTETALHDGVAEYHFSKSMHLEGRAFIEQQSGRIQMREVPPGSYQLRRRIEVNGLKNATVRFFSEEYCKDQGIAVLNTRGSARVATDPFEGEVITGPYGTYYEVRNVTGSIIFSMPRRGIFEQ